MDTLFLSDMKAIRRFFTWTNRHVWSKIDKVLCNPKWNLVNEIMTAQYKKNYFSDHTPIHIDVTPNVAPNRRPFRFLNILAEKDAFLAVVERMWSQNVQGTNIFKIWYKLKLCKQPLK